MSHTQPGDGHLQLLNPAESLPVLSVYTPFPGRPLESRSGLCSHTLSAWWYPAGLRQVLCSPIRICYQLHWARLGCSACSLACRGGPEPLFTAAALPPPLFPRDRGQGTGGRWPVVDSAQNSCWGQAHTLPVPCRDSGSLCWRNRKTGQRSRVSVRVKLQPSHACVHSVSVTTTEASPPQKAPLSKLQGCL